MSNLRVTTQQLSMCLPMWRDKVSPFRLKAHNDAGTRLTCEMAARQNEGDNETRMYEKPTSKIHILQRLEYEIYGKKR